MNNENNNSAVPRCWAVVPAAGIGTRMATDRPKQYLPLAGKTVIEHSLERLLGHAELAGGVVSIAPDDPYWSTLKVHHSKPLWLAAGGKERCDSVLNALEVLAEHADGDDWVLVHDAARPCLRPEDISTLIAQCRVHPVGGLLAMAVKDTIKRSAPVSADGLVTVQETVDRDRLWHALTPQMFRLAELRQALSEAIAAGVVITDEASAMEWAGLVPLLVPGHADNLKITHPEDLELASFFLTYR